MTTKATKRKTTKKHGKTRKSSKSHKKRTGGSMFATAAVPFGLLGLQRLFHSDKRNRGTRTRR